MPIGYNPDVINPGGIDYAEVDNLINPPNPANAGKSIVIDENGKPTLGESGGGGGGSNMIRIYPVDMPDTDPAMEDFPDVQSWQKNGDMYGLALTEDGEALSYSEIVSLFENNPNATFYYSGASLFGEPGKQMLISTETYYFKGGDAEIGTNIIANVTMLSNAGTYMFGVGYYG